MTLSILIVSCDRYADVWPTFFALFWKYWRDCPFPVYLGANQKTHLDPRVSMALSGDDPSWAESTRRMLAQVPGEYTLLLLEDFFIRRRVETSRIETLHRAILSLGGDYLRLRPLLVRPDTQVPGHPEIGRLEPGAPYRAALQAAIWKKQTLLGLLCDGESAWDMEIRGSRRSDALADSFYGTWRPAIDYYSAITKGRWVREAVRHCSREGLRLDTTHRQVMTAGEDLRLHLRRMRSRAIYMIPWQTRRRIKGFLQQTGLFSRALPL